MITKQKKKKKKKAKERNNNAGWGKGCSVCGQVPVVPETGMCGPCTFGEADTMGGNW